LQKPSQFSEMRSLTVLWMGLLILLWSLPICSKGATQTHFQVPNNGITS